MASNTLPRAATDRALADLQTRARELVAGMRQAVAEHVFRAAPGDAGSATGLFAAVPTEACLALVHLCHAARAAGYTDADLTARLGAEGRLIFEMVVGMYDTACLTPLPALLESAARLRDALT